MGSLCKFALLTTAAIVVATAANAADLVEPPIFEHTPEIIPAEVGSNWYLRGDIGYSVNMAPEARGGGGRFFNESVKDTWMAGIGFGYKFNDYFRADLTADYRDRYKFKATTPCIGACGPTRHETSFSAWTFMANGYLDLGTWQGFTPYVGAGLGAAYIMTANHDVTNTAPPNFTYAGGDRWSLAAAAMAGASYQLTDNLLLDAGYRYLWLGDAESGRERNRAIPGTVKYEDLQAHEIRVGLRYLID